MASSINCRGLGGTPELSSIGSVAKVLIISLALSKDNLLRVQAVLSTLENSSCHRAETIALYVSKRVAMDCV